MCACVCEWLSLHEGLLGNTEESESKGAEPHLLANEGQRQPCSRRNGSQAQTKFPMVRKERIWDRDMSVQGDLVSRMTVGA